MAVDNDLFQMVTSQFRVNWNYGIFSSRFLKLFDEFVLWPLGKSKYFGGIKKLREN